jgi:hypothetical protein
MAAQGGQVARKTATGKQGPALGGGSGLGQAAAGAAVRAQADSAGHLLGSPSRGVSRCAALHLSNSLGPPCRAHQQALSDSRLLPMPQVPPAQRDWRK